MEEATANNWKPVEFRCMIQDILGNEIYNKHNSDEFSDRTIFYCITVPGENDWVRSCPKGTKNEFMTSNEYQHPQTSANSTEVDHEPTAKLSFTLVNWSYPIPSNGKNRSCLIKVYDMKLVDSLRVNDIVYVSGLIEPLEFEDDSQLLTNKSSPNTNGDNDPAIKITESDGFEPANDFPHGLVPRVHVRKLKKLNHINPLLPDLITRDTVDITTIKLARARLTTILTTLLGGDSLAAEYLTLSLISRIYKRKDVTSLGQFTVGLSGVKPEIKFLVDKLYEIISRITTHSHLIDMSIANLNNLRFTPQKDHEHNKMISGTLQLPDGLYLMINETALTEGQLTPQGTSNLSTLVHIVRWQKHKYDFKSFPVEIDTDLKVLVMSEGKSLLDVPYSVKLKEDSMDSMKQACESVDDFLSEDLLNMFRCYITALKDAPEFTVTEEVSQIIQQDYCNWRKTNEINGQVLFSANDLSSYMTLARYLTISRGESALTRELWRETCDLETERQSRLKSTK